MKYKVEREGRDLVIRGLMSGPINEYADTEVFLRLDEGDIKTPETQDEVHRALYDEFQVNDRLRDGDEFETPFGNFRCEGVHVVRA